MDIDRILDRLTGENNTLINLLRVIALNPDTPAFWLPDVQDTLAEYETEAETDVEVRQS